MLNNMKIGTKLIGGFLVVAFITLVVGFLGWNGAANLGQDAEEIADVRLPSLDSLRIIQREFEVINVAQRTLLNPLLNKEDYQRQSENITKARERYQAAWQIYEPLPQTAEEAELWKQFVPAIDAWRKENNVFFEMVKQLEATGIRNPSELMQNLQQVRADFWKLEAVLYELIENKGDYKDGDWLNAAWVDRLAVDNPEIQRLLREAGPLSKTLLESVAKVRELAAQGDVDRAGAEFKTVFKPAKEKLIALCRPMRAEATRALECYEKMNQQALVQCRDKQVVATALLEKIIKINDDVAKKASAEVKREVFKSETVAVVGMLLGTLFAVIVGFVLTRRITAPLRAGVSFVNTVAEGDVSRSLEIDQKDEIGVLSAAMNRMVKNQRAMVGAAERIADGDLTVVVKPMSEKDALGNALKHMVEKLSNVVSEINVSAGNVAAGAEQMSSTSQAMSQGATEQASSLEEISSSMNEIASQTKQNAENASQGQQAFRRSKGVCHKGQYSDAADG